MTVRPQRQVAFTNNTFNFLSTFALNHKTKQQESHYARISSIDDSDKFDVHLLSKSN